MELTEFVKKYNIGKSLIPETCFPRIFKIAYHLNELNVKTYAIPNIEIVRKDELFKHSIFHKVLCNNYYCEKIMNDYDISRTAYIGYGIEQTEQLHNKKKDFGETLKYLFIGGMNAFSRKHILLICEAFSLACEKIDNIELTCTIQMTNNLEIEHVGKINTYKSHPKINIISDHLAYSEILNKYYDHHISIQVSKHEGLGLGFYEGLCTGTPIMTLNTPPHNEIIKDGINGWVLQCYHLPMTDNKSPIFDSAYFDPNDLASKIIEI